MNVLFKMTRVTFMVSLLFILCCCSEEEEATPETTEEEVITPEMPEDTENDEESEESTAFVFANDLVMEHSWNTGGCDDGPCDTVDESLSDVFEDGQPDDPYFFQTADGAELNLKCQLDEGRRTEFKQISRGPLTRASRIEFEAVYFDIPAEGMTIAQVHNRGGSSNKPFFRLEMHEDELETVVRRDPEVNSNETTFDKVTYAYVNGAEYNGELLKVILEKNNGVVRLHVTQGDTVLINESYAPDADTNWVLDTGIANGYYLKAGVYNPAAPHTEDIVLQYTVFKYESDD